MMLRRVITTHARTDPAPQGGGTRSSGSGAGLRRDLEKVIRKNSLYFGILWGLIALLFVGTVVVVWLWRGEPGKASAVFAVLGVSTAGLLRTMQGLWRDKSRTEMLVMLVTELDRATAQTILTILARKL